MTYRISNFARTKGAKDKQERKKRGVGGYIAAGAGVGLAGRLGGGYLGNKAEEAFKTGRNAYVSAAQSTKAANSASELAKTKNALADSLAGSGNKMYADAARKEAFEAGSKANKARQAVKQSENLGEKFYKSAKSLGRYGKAAKIAGKVGVVGLVGKGLYNLARNKQDERQSLGGQAKMLKNKIKEKLGR